MHLLLSDWKIAKTLGYPFFFGGGGLVGTVALLSVAWSTGTHDLHFVTDFKWYCLAVQGSPTVTQHVASVESSFLLLHSIKTCFIC